VLSLWKHFSLTRASTRITLVAQNNLALKSAQVPNRIKDLCVARSRIKVNCKVRARQSCLAWTWEGHMKAKSAHR
jgi:hypothetical protein